jgi:hypothetical protein
MISREKRIDRKREIVVSGCDGMTPVADSKRRI